MADSFQDKTEKATPKRLMDARKKGSVAKSQDLTTSIILLGGLLGIFFLVPYIYGRLEQLYVVVFTHLNEPYDHIDTMAYWFRVGLWYVIGIVAPILSIVVILAFVGNIFQVGFMITPESMKPKLEKLQFFNIKNVKKLFDLSSVMRLIFGLCKMAVVVLIYLFMLNNAMNMISSLMHAEVQQMLVLIFKEIFYIGITVAVILLILGIADYVYQKWKFSNDMKMTKQEVKDEHKQAEGDRTVKQKLRSMMMDIVVSRMKSNVPQADVIVANPVHYAIAIKYDAENMAAPICVAKGARKIAVAIKEIAMEHKIPIVENPPLARALYRAVDVGMFVPPIFYHAIAEVLAYVYKLNEKMGYNIPNIQRNTVTP